MIKGKVTEEIKDRLPVDEVVSSYIKLEKAGRNFKAVCPFHNEKTPSFVVSPERQSFYCFGCQKGGDIFSFVEEFEGVEFKEALRILADKAGIDLGQYSLQKNDKGSDDLLVVLEKATGFFENKLRESEEAKKYLKERGLEGKTAVKFRIGYANDGWQELTDYLRGEGIKEDQIVATGLAIRNEKGRVYDRFRGRVIFPMFNERGQVVAYSARILTNTKDQPKYINSPETELFNKSRVLYGFNYAKSTIRKHDFVILVEGQMDVLMAHQVGYTNTVASSGTSFTEDQLGIIKRHTKNLLIAFDGDSAGAESGKKVWELAIKNDMDVKVLPLEPGEDPADVIVGDKARWVSLVKSSVHIIEYFADNILRTTDDRRKQLKRLQVEIYPYLSKVSGRTERSYFINILSEKFGVNKEDIIADLGQITVPVQTRIVEEKRPEGKKEREVLEGIYYWQKSKEGREININEFEKILGTIGEKNEKDIYEVEKLYEGMDVKRIIDELLTKIRVKELSKQKENIKDRLSNFRGETNEETELMRTFEELSRKIKKLETSGCREEIKVL